MLVQNYSKLNAIFALIKLNLSFNELKSTQLAPEKTNKVSSQGFSPVDLILELPVLANYVKHKLNNQIE